MEKYLLLFKAETGNLFRKTSVLFTLMFLFVSFSASAETVTVGIGTQNTTTDTVTGGIIIKELGLMKKYLPTTGKYKNIHFKFDWENFTSGPPVTNGMIANKLQIGMMGDYPLLVNGSVFQHSHQTKSELIAIIAYNADGAGNGVVVRANSPYYQLSDLKGKRISVPFGSAAHGMLLKAMEDRGWKKNYWHLLNQSPEVGTTNLQEGKIDAHADFVPFADLLPYQGWARKIFSGVETKVPTFHGVVVRKDFADKYPEVVVAYLRALMDANDWLRKNPKLAAEKIQKWTGVPKEVDYLYLGPSGIDTLDPTIKPKWIDAIKYDTGVLKRMGMVKSFDVDAWPNDTYLRTAFKERGEDYDKQLVSVSNYQISGMDNLCHKPITDPMQAGEVWIENGDISAYSSPDCTLAAVNKATSDGKKIDVVYLIDHAFGIKVFAKQAFYSVDDKDPKKPVIVPFLLKKDAAAYAKQNGGHLATYTEALAAAKI
ncbi:ABC transporter substrate-binding protein [Halothiobacillus sp.]|uniref:ABC transporter substrate-binding protein n=1 Tax=Halothiobacillus sp. TaxID=1891311 RepID=UPI002AD43A86|nr:ABC transporter substrate-binding protein [Halothiobacillus sp.]